MRKIWPCLLFIILIISGCQSDTDPPNQSGTGNSSVETFKKKNDQVKLKVTINKKELKQGDKLKVTSKATNFSDKPFKFSGNSCAPIITYSIKPPDPNFDLISNEDSMVNPACLQYLKQFELKPHHSVSSEATIKLSLKNQDTGETKKWPKGTYTITIKYNDLILPVTFKVK